jgi:3-oxoacyl-[acyl-carrier protein] reductase
MGDLGGKVAIVTGATQAMGEAIARRLADDGASVLGVGRSEERGRAVVDRLTAAGLTADFVVADVGREVDVAGAVAAAVQRFGGVDIVVNNAAALDGSSPEAAAHLESSETFDAILKVNLYGPFWFAKYAAPVMMERSGGLFVNISSYAASRGVAGIPAYTCSKAGLEALTRQVAAEYGEHGIRANVLVLGSIEVPRNANLHRDAEASNALRLARMTDRPGRPSDVAAAVAFLASDQAAFITGAALALDGGLLAKAPMVKVVGWRANAPTIEPAGPGR